MAKTCSCEGVDEPWTESTYIIPPKKLEEGAGAGGAAEANLDRY